MSSAKKEGSKERVLDTREAEADSDRKGEVHAGDKVEDKVTVEEVPKGTKRVAQPAPKSKSKGKAKAREFTPSDHSSDDDFEPNSESLTAGKRRRTHTSKTNGPADMSSPLSKVTGAQDCKEPEKDLGEMTTDELLAHHGVNTLQSPYMAHLLSRHEPVVSDPVIEIPEVVKRGFKRRPTAEEIQQNIQDKVREKMGLRNSPEEGSGSQ